MKYEKPVVQRFGSLRELTLGGGIDIWKAMRRT